MRAPEDYIPIRVFHDFVGRLEGLGINYMLTGSMAMMRYTVFRLTADIDIVIEVEPTVLDSLIRAIEPDYYVPRQSARQALEERRVFNVIHQETAFKVDCIPKKLDEYHRTAFERREMTDFYGLKASVISKEDLILAKLLWAKDSGSELQRRDIASLIRSGYDQGYVEGWVSRLGVEELYGSCIKDACE